MEYDGDFIRTGVPAGLRHPRIGVARLHPLAFNVNASQRRSHDIGRLGAARELLATVRRVPRVGEPMSKLELATFALSAGVNTTPPHRRRHYSGDPQRLSLSRTAIPT